MSMRNFIQRTLATAFSIQLFLGVGIFYSPLSSAASAPKTVLESVNSLGGLCLSPTVPVTDMATWKAGCDPLAQKVFASAKTYDKAYKENVKSREAFNSSAGKVAVSQNTVLKGNNAGQGTSTSEAAAKSVGQDYSGLQAANTANTSAAKAQETAAADFETAVTNYNGYVNQPTPQVPAGLVAKTKAAAEESVADAEKKSADTAGTGKNLLSTLGPLAAIAGLGALMMGMMGKDDGSGSGVTAGDNITCSPGTEKDYSGTCVAIVCDDGESFDYSKAACVADDDSNTCTTGMVKNDAGVCVVSDGKCSEAEYPDEDGVCIAKPTCADNEYFNTDYRSCLAKNCQIGETLQSDGTCKKADGDNNTAITLGNPDDINNNLDGSGGVTTSSTDEEDPFAALMDAEKSLGAGASTGGGSGSAGSGGSKAGVSGSGSGGGRNVAGSGSGAGAGAGGGYSGGRGFSAGDKDGEGGAEARVRLKTIKWTNPVIHKSLQESVNK